MDDEAHVQLPWIHGKDPYTGLEDLGDKDCPIEEKEDGGEGEKENNEVDDKKDVLLEDVNVESNVHPYVGMEFESADEAYDFYRMYGNRIGFNISRNTQTKSRSGLSSIRLVCSKEGFNKCQKHEQEDLESSTNPKTCEKAREPSRTGCKACLRVRRVKEGVWRVSVFSNDHNHELTPNSLSKKRERNLLSQKRLTRKGISSDLRSQNVGSSQAVENLVVKRRGKKSACSKKNDASSQIPLESRVLIGVAATLMEFQKKQEEDPEFFYAIEPDEDGFVKHLFWADGRSRRAYLEFGDVVTFDTTYNTDKNGMPLAPFIGVNHHHDTIFFGMALFRSECKKNFLWLFQTWLTAMYEKHPNAIITDQDPAMTDAIKIIFPKTVHRYCQWHVMRKTRQQLRSHYDQTVGYQDKLGDIINHSMTITDFEKAWSNMLDNCDLKSNRHLQTLYEKRSEWVPAYFRDTFFAEMSITQRSKSMNLLLELWMSSHTSIYKFVRKIESMVDSIWQKEDDEDIKTMNETPNLWSYYLIEADARRTYTRNVFSVFKELLRESTAGSCIEKERDALYEVRIKSHPLIPDWTLKSYLVEVDRASESFSCSCKGFEFEGLLCPHALKVMCRLGIQHLPAQYILKRWCKVANANVKRSLDERGMDPGNTPALPAFRSAALKLEFRKLAELASESAHAFNIALAKISELKAELIVRGGNHLLN